jgi:hypothetical protein
MNSKFVKVMSVAATAFVLLVSNPSNANPIKEKGTTKISEEQVSVNYVGANDNSLVFRVQFDNPTAQKFSLIIKNDVGEVVYQEQFTDVRFAKAIHLPKDEGEIHPTFVIRTSNQQVERSFAVNRTLTENVVVTKL